MTAVAAVVLGIVFLASGALKMRDEQWPAAARELGAPPLLVPLVAPVELVVGAFLIVDLWRRQAAIVAIVLLVIFTAVLLRALRRGETPTCSCFGSLSARPISGRSLVRNAAFLVLAVVAAS